MKYTGSLPRGREFLLISDNKAAAGTTVETIGIASDSVLVSVFCKSVTGTLQIRVFTEVDVGEDVEIITFPEITTATANLLIRKAALSMDRVRVEAVYSGASEYSVRVRGIGAGETSVRIEGQTSATASKEDIGTTPQVIIPSDMEDRTGLILKNNSTSGILYIGFTLAELAEGYPIGPGESLGMDLAGGQSIYGVSSSGTLDIRILQAGGS